MLVSYGGKPLSTRLKLRLCTKANKTLNCSQKKERTHISVSPPSVGMPKHRYV